jgi:hypothetical protein
MHGPDGTDYPNESAFRRLEPAALWKIEHVVAPWFTLTFTFAAAPGGTLVRWAQRFGDAELAARLESIILPANEQNLDRLHAVLAGGAPE